MKKKLAFMLCCAMALSLLLSACGDDASTPSSPASQPASTPGGSTATEYSVDFKKANNAIDELKTTACDQQGTVVSLEYDTPAYAINDLFGVEETLHKTLNIYLPYGYDESKQYNVLYLLHGTEGDADGPMEEYWLIQWGEHTRNVLDNMIKNGLCDPVIVVTPSYYSRVDGYDITSEQLDALAERLGNDSFINPAAAEDGGDPDNEQNVWPVYFGQELRGNIIPAVESQYSTYAGGDVSEANLIATREHRAFAGLSRGAMTVARSGLSDNADIFAYFGSFSGVWAEFDAFKAALTGKFADYDIKYWYNGNGRGDFALENHQTFKDRVLAEMGDKFTDGENFAWVLLRDGAHMYPSWIVDLYNSLLVFFR